MSSADFYNPLGLYRNHLRKQLLYEKMTAIEFRSHHGDVRTLKGPMALAQQLPGAVQRLAVEMEAPHNLGLLEIGDDQF